MNLLDSMLNMEVSCDDERTKRILNVLHEDRVTFLHTGSRSVLPESELAWNTDHDFIAIDTVDTRGHLLSLGFIFNGPEHVHYFDNTTSGISYWCDSNGGEIQVVLKKPEYWPILIEFWELLRANPKFYKKYFWKSSCKWTNSVNKPHIMSMIGDNINKTVSLLQSLNF